MNTDKLIPPPMDTENQQWLLSREWLARAAFLLIAAFVLLTIGAAFRPLLPVALIGVGVALYAVGRFMWHAQRSANARRRSHRRRDTHGELRIMSDWPVPLGLGFAALVVVGTVVIVQLRH
jgi:hypothetical protein